MSIFKRLILGNLIVLLLVALWGGAVIYKLGNLQKITTEIVEINGAILIVGDRLLDSFTSLMKVIKKYYVSGDMDYYHRVQDLEILLEEDFGLINRLIESDKQQSLFSDTKRLYIWISPWVVSRWLSGVVGSGGGSPRWALWPWQHILG